MLHLFFASLIVTVISVHDGDTLLIGLPTGADTLRIANIDAPELPPNAKCSGEEALAEATTRRLKSLLPEGSTVTFTENPGRPRDRYGRLLGTLSLPDGRDVGAILVAEKLARVWTGRRRPWCLAPAAP